MNQLEILDTPAPMTPRNSGLLYIIRIIAAQVVVVGHLFSFLQLTFLKNQTYFPYIQSLAVLMFFLMSGFLTDYSLGRKPANYSYWKYLKSHFFRIYESYLPALLFIAVVDRFFIYRMPDVYPHSATFSLEIFFKNLLMLPAKFVPLGSGRPLWTLYLEWWLYIGFGFLVLVCGKNLKQGKLRIWQVALLALLLYYPFKHSDKIPLWAFVFGILINRVYQKIEMKNPLLLVITVTAFLLWAAHIKNAYHMTVLILLALTLLQIMVLGHRTGGEGSGKWKKVLQFLSGCTYPLYLTHYTIVEYVLYCYPAISPWRKFWICWFVSNVVSVGFYWLVKTLSSRARKKK